MRVLIDECLNWRLARALTGHYCTSVQRMGWSGIDNGQLLSLAQEQIARELKEQGEDLSCGIAVQ